jgi:diphthamide synthase (EF-2-diphthine--ammonia ligase)
MPLFHGFWQEQMNKKVNIHILFKQGEALSYVFDNWIFGTSVKCTFPESSRIVPGGGVPVVEEADKQESFVVVAV